MEDEPDCERKVSKMKGTGILLAVLMVGLLAVVGLESVYAADRIELVVAAETAEVETGGGETFWTVIEPFGREYAAGRIEKCCAAESAEVGVEMGAGEVAGILMTPFECKSDRIELLCPAK